MDSSPHIDELRQLLARGEPQASKAARLRPLLPRIVQRLNAGAPRHVIVQQLNQAGLAVSLHDLAKQLQRYRRQQHRASDNNRTHCTEHAVPLKAATVKRCSPAELRQIRDMNIDLEALRQEGEQLRRQTPRPLCKTKTVISTPHSSPTTPDSSS